MFYEFVSASDNGTSRRANRFPINLKHQS